MFQEVEVIQVVVLLQNFILGVAVSDIDSYIGATNPPPWLPIPPSPPRSK